MTKALYMDDSYLKEFSTKIKNVNENNIILEETAFYPSSGGQPHDTGIIKNEEEEYHVIDVFKKDGEIIHTLNKPGLKEGDTIQGIINWERRYPLMKAHTATHIICSVIHKKLGALITGNQLYEDRLRIDFNLENYDKELLEALIEETNNIIKTNKDVTHYYLPRDEANKVPGALKLANTMPPNIKELRIVEIKDVDHQVDGGTHVKNTEEIGALKFLKTENKGKNNRRLVVSLIKS